MERHAPSPSNVFDRVAENRSTESLLGRLLVCVIVHGSPEIPPRWPEHTTVQSDGRQDGGPE